jgi:hypothetical protein
VDVRESIYFGAGGITLNWRVSVRGLLFIRLSFVVWTMTFFFVRDVGPCVVAVENWSDCPNCLLMLIFLLMFTRVLRSTLEGCQFILLQISVSSRHEFELIKSWPLCYHPYVVVIRKKIARYNKIASAEKYVISVL